MFFLPSLDLRVHMLTLTTFEIFSSSLATSWYSTKTWGRVFTLEVPPQMDLKFISTTFLPRRTFRKCPKTVYVYAQGSSRRWIYDSFLSGTKEEVKLLLNDRVDDGSVNKISDFNKVDDCLFPVSNRHSTLFLKSWPQSLHNRKPRVYYCNHDAECLLTLTKYSL